MNANEISNGIRNLAEELEKKDKTIELLLDQVGTLKKALNILMNVKPEDKTPEGIQLSVRDFSTVYEAMFCNADIWTEDGCPREDALDLQEEHLYGHDVYLAWHGLWCNLQDGAIAYNYVMCNLDELADELEE